MIKIHPQTMLNKYVIYLLQDDQMNDVFMYFCKFTDLLKIEAAVQNPAFDITRTYTLCILAWCNNARDTQNTLANLVNERGMTQLNMTLHFNRIGTIVCDQTGHIYRNQSDVCRMHNISSAQLSQHIQRKAGFKTVKGMTFSRAAYLDETRRGTTKQVAPLEYVNQRQKAVICNETEQYFKSQKEACEVLGMNRAQLSKHLQGCVGFKTVKGMTFRNANSPAPKFIPVKYP